MKKILCMAISVLLVLSAAGCGNKDVMPNENKTEVLENTDTEIKKAELPFAGEWQVLEAEFKTSSDVMKKTMITLLKNRIKKDSVIKISNDLTGSVDGENVTYKWENGILTMVFDDSKNFNFHLTFDDGKMEMEIDDVAEFELIKK